MHLSASEQRQLAVASVGDRRRRVERAVEALGTGFLQHPANTELRMLLAEGRVTAPGFYQAVLRQVYRLLFRMAAEDQGLLFDSSVESGVRAHYADRFSMSHLRDLARDDAHDGSHQLWRDVRTVHRALALQGVRDLGLPELGGLFDAVDITDGCEVSDAHLLGAVRLLAGGVTDLGRIHEGMLELHPDVENDTFTLRPGAGNRRRTGGSYYTPDGLVSLLLEVTLDPLLDEAMAGPEPGQALLDISVCDPACGAGHFLIAAARRIAARLSRVRDGDDDRGALRDVLTHCIHGVDLDPLAVDLTRAALWLEAAEPGRSMVPLTTTIRVGDALPGTDDAFDWERGFPQIFRGVRPGFAAVVGNPPFQGQLKGRPQGRDPAFGPYTDPSALFLALGLRITRADGSVGMVQPQSVLAARDAGPVRADLIGKSALTAIWVSPTGVFDANVLTCAIACRKGMPQGVVRRFLGPSYAPASPAPGPVPEAGSEWGPLVADLLGTPTVEISSTTTVSAFATATADFRDQYYGLAPYVVDLESPERPEDFPALLTSGLIDLADNKWGRVDTRFNKVRYRFPRVDLQRLGTEDPRLHAWARSRLRPKILVATQSAVIECLVDADGRLLPSVPVITVAPREGVDLWALAAVLSSPVAAAQAATHFVGAGLTMHVIKMSAKQVLRLAAPEDLAAFAAAGAYLRQAQGATDEALRRQSLLLAASESCRVMGASDEVLQWWEARL